GGRRLSSNLRRGGPLPYFPTRVLPRPPLDPETRTRRAHHTALELQDRVGADRRYIAEKAPDRLTVLHRRRRARGAEDELQRLPRQGDRLQADQRQTLLQRHIERAPALTAAAP